MADNMAGISLSALFGLAVAAAFLLYIIAWYATRRLPGMLKFLLRLLLAGIFIAPFVWLVLEPSRLEQIAGKLRGALGGTFSKNAAAPEKSIRKRRRYQRKVDKSRSKPIAPKSAPAAPGSSKLSKPGRSPAGESRPSQIEGAMPEDRDNEGRSTRGIIAGSAPKWDVVPVFFGTDRKQVPNVMRVSYGAERAKRLELGRALVTIPKTHQVPVLERPWVYTLPFTSIVILRENEDPSKHFTLRDVRILNQADFLALVRSRLASSKRFANHALIFIHGFNTTFDYALYRSAQLTYDLKFDGAPFVYSWPSRGEITPTGYSYDRESAEQAEPHLKKFVKLVASQTGATTVSIIAHSMGNKALLPVLRDFKRSMPEGVKLSQIILAAPDVDRDGFEFLAKEIRGVSKGMTLYAASNDWALDISRQFWGGVPRAGDVPPGGPIVITGIDTIDVTATSTEIFSLNHSGYAEKSALLNDIQLLLQTGERPPEKRVPILQRIKTSKGDYWKYPG